MEHGSSENVSSSSTTKKTGNSDYQQRNRDIAIIDRHKETGNSDYRQMSQAQGGHLTIVDICFSPFFVCPHFLFAGGMLRAQGGNGTAFGR